MDCYKIYKSIIDRRVNDNYCGYVEKHHIIPKSLGGSNSKDNIVELSAREHFICHYLLTRIYPEESVEWYKMQFAFLMMRCNSYNQDRYFNSRLYDYLKNNRSALMSISQKGKNNSQYGTYWISSISERKSFKIPKDSPVPEGYVKGRNVWVSLDKKNNLQYKKNIDDINMDNHCKHLFTLFKNGNYKSVLEFFNTNDIPFSIMTLMKRWKKIEPSYKPVEGKSFSSLDARNLDV